MQVERPICYLERIGPLSGHDWFEAGQICHGKAPGCCFCCHDAGAWSAGRMFENPGLALAPNRHGRRSSGSQPDPPPPHTPHLLLPCAESHVHPAQSTAVGEENKPTANLQEGPTSQGTKLCRMNLMTVWCILPTPHCHVLAPCLREWYFRHVENHKCWMYTTHWIEESPK